MASVTCPRRRVKPRRTINLILPPTRTMPGLVRIQVEGECWTDYNLAPLPGAFGTAFRLVKLLGPWTGYDVLLDGERSSCECRGFLRPGHCKPVDGMQALVNRGALAAKGGAA